MSTTPSAKESTNQAGSHTTRSSDVLCERDPTRNSETELSAPLAGESKGRDIEMAKPELASRRARSLSTTSNLARKSSNGAEVSAVASGKENSIPPPGNGLDHSIMQFEVNHRIAGRPTFELSSRELPKFRKTKSENPTSSPTKSSEVSAIPPLPPPTPVCSAPRTDSARTGKNSSVNVDQKREAVPSAPPARAWESSSRRTVQFSTARTQSSTISCRGVPSSADSSVQGSSSDNVLRRQCVFPPTRIQCSPQRPFHLARTKMSNAASETTSCGTAPRRKKVSPHSPASQTITAALTSSSQRYGQSAPSDPPHAESSSRRHAPPGKCSSIHPSVPAAGQQRASVLPPTQSRTDSDKHTPHPQHSIPKPNGARNALPANTPARQPRIPTTTPTSQRSRPLPSRCIPMPKPISQLPPTASAIASKIASSAKAAIATPAFQQSPFELTPYHRMTAKDFPKFKKVKLDAESATGAGDTLVATNRPQPDTSDIRRPIASSSKPLPQVGSKRPREDDEDDGIERIYCPWILDSGEHCSREHHTGKGLITHIMCEHFEKVDGIDKTECRYDGCGAMVRNLRQHLQTTKGHSGLAHLLGLKN